MLTNWQTVSNSIRTLRKQSETLAEGGTGLKKKEKLEMGRSVEKLEKAIGGIKDIGGLPDLLFIIDTNKESLAIAEAKKLGIPVIAICDSNCDPDPIDYPVPGNDDSIRAIELYCRLFSDAVLSGISQSLGARAASAAAAKPEAVVVELPKAEEKKEEKKAKKEEEKPKVETVVKKSRKKKVDDSAEASEEETTAKKTKKA
jgi:small subunit ribosomal protein S2